MSNNLTFKVFYICLLCIPIDLEAQDKIKIKKEGAVENTDTVPQKRHYASRLNFDVLYGQRGYDKPFDKGLNRLDKFDVNMPPKTVGFGFSDYAIHYNPRGYILVQMYLIGNIKRALTPNDSLDSKISGFSYNFGLGRKLMRRSSRFNVFIYTGFNAGSTKIECSAGKYKNTFFSPKLSVQPKFWLSRRISLSAIFEYEYDVSKTPWKMKNGSIGFSNFNQSGAFALLSLGYSLIPR
ncbi:MAG: hypothetical protein SGJ15_08880 [Bacteroidota bacterium]|nr:hypothetical protein [Bacteroidota bacterium]